MRVKNRVFVCRLIEKIEKHETYAKGIGITNVSSFKGSKNHISTDKSKIKK